MSRGPGRVEREIGKLLQEHPDADFTVTEIARHVFGSVTNSQSRSVRRALRNVMVSNPTWTYGPTTRRNHPFGPGGDEAMIVNRASARSGTVMAERLEELSGAQDNITKHVSRP